MKRVGMADAAGVAGVSVTEALLVVEQDRYAVRRSGK
jgi:hypothetical protein